MANERDNPLSVELAEYAKKAGDAETLDGHPASYFAQARATYNLGAIFASMPEDVSQIIDVDTIKKPGAYLARRNGLFVNAPDTWGELYVFYMANSTYYVCQLYIQGTGRMFFRRNQNYGADGWEDRVQI